MESVRGDSLLARSRITVVINNGDLAHALYRSQFMSAWHTKLSRSTMSFHNRFLAPKSQIEWWTFLAPSWSTPAFAPRYVDPILYVRARFLIRLINLSREKALRPTRYQD